VGGIFLLKFSTEMLIRTMNITLTHNYTLDYNNINEKTGYDCAKWLVDYFYDNHPEYILMSRGEKKNEKIPFPTVYVHSANPIGAANIMGYINNFFMNEGQPQTCIRVQIPHN